MNTLDEIRKFVGEVISEDKKKKKKKEELKANHVAKPSAYSYSESFDFSAPLGSDNLYKVQGESNWGPMTGPGVKFDATSIDQRSSVSEVLSGIVKESSEPSAWASLVKEENVHEGPWDYLKNIGSQALGAAKKKAADIKKGAQAAHSQAKDASADADQKKQAASQAAAKKSAVASVVSAIRDTIPAIQKAEDFLSTTIEKLDGDPSEQNVARAIDTLSNASDTLGNVVASIEGIAPAKGGKPSGSRGKRRLPSMQHTQGTPKSMDIKAR